ncbi:MAG: aminotransferase class I/II-fold pyridoxal phosphate-dependent enzyme [Cyclobacteriaceae bacterium]
MHLCAMPTDKIWLSSPHMGGQELKFVEEAFASNWISPVGPHLEAFEKELGAYVGVEHCAALSSGTAAIHLALIVLGVERGDEVICSSFTFSGSCNPIAYQDATPVFVDSEEETWNMDPDLLEKAILDRVRATGKRPKAIILVHLYGMPAQVDEILAISKKYGIPVIEDAAEAIGSSYKGKRLGSFGEIGIFSFNGNKIITTSGGGALVSSNREWVDKAKFLATQARDKAPHYEHSSIGYNYRLSNVCAGIGRGQLMVLDERVRQRRAVYERYHQKLAREGFIFVPELKEFYSNRWLTTVLLSSNIKREKVRLMLEKQNIESRPLWKPMHLQPIFRNYPRYLSGISERLFDIGLCLPSGSQMSDFDVDRVCSVLVKNGY